MYPSLPCVEGGHYDEIDTLFDHCGLMHFSLLLGEYLVQTKLVK